MFLTTVREADLATLAFAFCTSFLVYCRDSQENILMTLCLLGGIWHGLNWSKHLGRGHAAALAVFLGFLILVRVSTIAVIFPFCGAFCYLALREWGTARKRELGSGILIIGGILLCFVILDRIYHWYRFGEFTRTYAYYMVEQAKALGFKNNYPMGNPYLDGIRGFFLSPRKAFLLFDPLLAFGVLAALPWIASSRAARILTAASALSIFLTASLYARSDFWPGEASWGPRHLNIAIVPAALFSITITASHLSSRGRTWLRPAFRTALVVSFVIQALSLPLFQEVEVHQLNSGYPVRYPPALRVCNLVAKATGNPGLWHLDCESERIRLLQNLPLQFTPFQILHAISNTSAAYLLISAWLLSVAAFTFGMVMWIASPTCPRPKA